MGAGEEEFESELGRLPSVHMPPLTGRVPLLAFETEIFARGRRLIMEGFQMVVHILTMLCGRGCSSYPRSG